MTLAPASKSIIATPDIENSYKSFLSKVEFLDSFFFLLSQLYAYTCTLVQVKEMHLLLSGT